MVYTSVVQSEDTMRVFIALAVLVCRWWMVCGIGRCPFPGIPANAVALNERNETITWRNRSPFTERQIVKYFCVGLDEAIVRLASEFSCKDDGQWSDSLPRCGNQLSNYAKS